MRSLASQTIDGQLLVRRTCALDLPQLEALLSRCSLETQYRRFHGAVGHAMRRELVRIVTSSPEHRSWVASDAGIVRGTATLAWGADGTVEAAFLVEDAWFRQGVGRALFAAVAAEAQASGVDTVVAWVQADNEKARRFFRTMAPGARTRFAGSGELEVTVPIPVRDRHLSSSTTTSSAIYRESA